MSQSSTQQSPRITRSIVTEEALHVSPDVLGLPLARPWRRAAAIGVDGILCSILTNAPSVLFGFAAAFVLFRVSGRRKAGGGYFGRSMRFTFRLGGALVLFWVAMGTWDMVRDGLRAADAEEDRQVEVAFETGSGAARSMNLTGLAAVGFAGEVVQLHRAETEVDGRQAARAMLDRMRAAGVPDGDVYETLRELAAAAEGKPWLRDAVEEVIAADAASDGGEEDAGEADGIVAPEPDSLIVAYAAALEEGDSAAIDSLRPGVISAVAADTVGAMAGTISALDEERAQLTDEVRQLREEMEQGPGVLAFLRSLVDDLGLGLGWFGLYFTATTAMWHGRTPGKRLFGIRVISLTGKPIGWWASFERFGGYAAGFATGLLGFLQVLWDDNRQAIHDKIAVTAVIREHVAPPDRRES